jgi:hypothetical protein
MKGVFFMIITSRLIAVTVAVFLLSIVLPGTIYSGDYEFKDIENAAPPTVGADVLDAELRPEEPTTTPSAIEVVVVTEEIEVMSVHPDARAERKPWMDYRTISDQTSNQYALQQTAITDDFGLRLYDGMPMVAVGKHYAGNVGDVLLIELSDGSSFKAVVGDFKATAHTNATQQYATADGSVVEFIVDRSRLSRAARRAGDISAIIYDGEVTGIANLSSPSS